MIVAHPNVKKWLKNKKDQEDFSALIEELAKDPKSQRMKQFIQHGTITTFDHCVDVSCMSFLLNRRMGTGCDEKQLVRAAFLHDYYLYDWHDHQDHLHGYHHPAISARNAKRDFQITEHEEKIIQSHMWPLTLFHAPTSREAWIVTLADKICSSRETLFERGWSLGAKDSYAE